MLATKFLKFAKFTLAIAVDYPFGVRPATWSNATYERLRAAGVDDMSAKYQGMKGVPTGLIVQDDNGNFVVPPCKSCGYMTVTISRMAAPVGEEHVLDKAALAIYVLESHFSDSQMSVEQKQWIGEEVCRLRFDDLHNNSLLNVSVVVHHNGNVWMHTWCSGGRLFALSTGAKTVMLGTPRMRMEIRAIDPTLQDACGTREERSEVVWHDKRSGLKLQTDAVDVPSETMRIANPGNATNNLIKEAQAAGSPVDGPDPALGPKLMKSVHANWISRNDFVTIANWPSCGFVLKQAAGHWGKLDGLRLPAGHHHIIESQGVVPRDGPVEVPTECISFGYSDGVSAPVLPTGEGKPAVPARMECIAFEADGAILRVVTEVKKDSDLDETKE